MDLFVAGYVLPKAGLGLLTNNLLGAAAAGLGAGAVGAALTAAGAAGLAFGVVIKDSVDDAFRKEAMRFAHDMEAAQMEVQDAVKAVAARGGEHAGWVAIAMPEELDDWTEL